MGNSNKFINSTYYLIRSLISKWRIHCFQVRISLFWKFPNTKLFIKNTSKFNINQNFFHAAQVSDLLKPVSDPLVEATRKISENLGLSSSRSQTSVAQDKIGTVATGSSVLFPALGLVASGAALGIGAVAVGRYLDVDVLKRSNSEGLVPENNEERAMNVLEQLQDQGVLDEVQQVREAGANGNVYVVMQDKPQGVSRRKRSSGNDDAGSRWESFAIHFYLVVMVNGEWLWLFGWWIFHGCINSILIIIVYGFRLSYRF